MIIMHCEECGASMVWRCTNTNTNIAKYKCPRCGSIKEVIDDYKHFVIETRKPKYYHICKGRYVVHKVIEGKNIYFGSFGDEETAQKIVDRLKACDWDKDLMPLIRDEVCEI